ncbi:glycosyltransferase [Sphingomonas ginkgonis]|uniref:Glycosyltransferase n=1 Tax=Sphingomonas ginkgonis TaxID=2315330 RepID=A0A429VDT1_9SPHN|nr:glycosyltransferase [Sphingomonas ginkgonis]RST32017.1 glycosyltransferase [Sphingomonas ginkgonis]
MRETNAGAAATSLRSTPPPRLLIVTGQHFATQPRRVDLHFMADALVRRGVPVDFLSVRLSLLSKLARDDRWGFARTRRWNRWNRIGPLQEEYIWFRLVHAARTRSPMLNRWSAGIEQGAAIPPAVRARLTGYSDILVESGAALFLLPRLRRLAPQARIIYHAADRLETIGAHPRLGGILRDHAGDIDLVHVVAEALRSEVPHQQVVYLPHGLSKEAFAAVDAPSPFAGSRNAVCVGDMLFDADAVETMARAFPDWTFHLFGRKARTGSALPNVVAHGERPFDEIAGYIRHADIGLAPYLDERDADYISQSSMKMIQYSYMQLPIVAPAFAAAGRDHVCAYTPGNPESIVAAFERATRFDRARIDQDGILSWDEKVARLFPAAGR